MLGHIDNVCGADQANNFTCPNGRTTWSSSVIWGLIGPARLYSAGKIYSGLLHFFWIGALAPVITWYLYRKTGRIIFKQINWPLIFVGTYNVPPSTGINYTSWALVNVIFNLWIFKKFFAWCKFSSRLASTFISSCRHSHPFLLAFSSCLEGNLQCLHPDNLLLRRNSTFERY